MGREGSWWILLGSLRWMGLLLATLEAWSWGRTRSWSLGGGRCVVLKLLLLLLLWLRWARLRGSRLSAVSCREGGREGVSLIYPTEGKEREQLPFFFLNPNYFYSYQHTAYRTAAAVGEHLVAEAGIHLEPGTGTPGLNRQEKHHQHRRTTRITYLKTKCEQLCITSVTPFILPYNIQMLVPQAAINPWCIQLLYMGQML